MLAAVVSSMVGLGSIAGVGVEVGAARGTLAGGAWAFPNPDPLRSLIVPLSVNQTRVTRPAMQKVVKASRTGWKPGARSCWTSRLRFGEMLMLACPSL